MGNVRVRACESPTMSAPLHRLPSPLPPLPHHSDSMDRSYCVRITIYLNAENVSRDERRSHVDRLLAVIIAINRLTNHSPAALVRLGHVTGTCIIRTICARVLMRATHTENRKQDVDQERRNPAGSARALPIHKYVNHITFLLPTLP